MVAPGPVPHPETVADEFEGIARNYFGKLADNQTLSPRRRSWPKGRYRRDERTKLC